MTKRICENCKSTNIRKDKYIDNGSDCYICEDCCRVGKADEFPEYTVFHQITSSPEVLAPKLVYRSFIRREEIRGNGLFLEVVPIKIKCYKSKVTPGVHYKNSAEAIAATVAKLKTTINDIKENI